MQYLFAALLSLLQATYPPPYPRPGATKLIDNERVVVWDVSWPRSDTAPLHRHLYDLTGVYYWPGARMITSPDGAKHPLATNAGQIQWQLKGVTHAEDGTSDDPLRAVMIELKGDGPSGNVIQSAESPAYASSTSLLDNNRVTVSAWTPASSAPTRHFHRTDTVVVFTGNHTGRAIFVKAGEAHDDERAAPEGRITVFELK